MRLRTCLALLAAGLGMLIVGLAYDVVFAGIPYQDPTPEMTASYTHHARIARGIETVGLLVWALGLINLVLSWVHGRVSKRREQVSDDGQAAG